MRETFVLVPAYERVQSLALRYQQRRNYVLEKEGTATVSR